MATATAKPNGRAPRSLAPPVEIAPVPTGLMDALLAVQGEAVKLQPNADGQVQSRTYKYVTLGALMAAVQPLLTAHGLVWVTLPTTDEHGSPAITYRLTHVASGEALEDTMPLMCAHPDPQGQGSAITYARRYALMAVLSMATEDDDGKAASGRQPNAQVEGQAQPTAAPAKPSHRPATVPQRKLVRTRAGIAGLSPTALANVIKVAAGEEPIDWSNEAAATRWLGRAIDRLPARLVDDVLEGIERS